MIKLVPGNEESFLCEIEVGSRERHRADEDGVGDGQGGQPHLRHHRHRVALPAANGSADNL